MRRRFVLVTALAVIAAVAIAWQCRSSDDAAMINSGSSTAATQLVRSHARPDPKTLARAAIGGTVRDDRGTPIAGAKVCGQGVSIDLADELLHEPACATTDERGAYAMAGLYPARYTVSASARAYVPALYVAGGRRELRLAAGEHQTGIDLVLRAGGVELTGSVTDLTGGPIAKAKVWARDFIDQGSAIVPADTDDKGAFTVWVRPGDVLVTASADGYADASDNVEASARVVRRIDLVLTPEASLAGVVVDAASGLPVAGAHVMVGTSDWGWDSGESTLSDEHGAFRVSGLVNRRYVVVARTDHGFGRTDGSTLVGLAQHVAGVVVKLHPARRIEGRITIAGGPATCEQGSVSLHDPAANRFVELRRATDDGMLFADGVFPARYEVTVYCKGYLPRDTYAPVVVTADRDAVGIVWDVEAGARLRGKVATFAGEPVEGAFVRARTVKGGARDKDGYGSAKSERDGSYELVGLRPGSYKVEVSAERGFGPRDGVEIEIAAGATASKDLTIDDGGAITGTVADAEGRPVGGVDIDTRALGGERGDETKTDATGAFTVAPLRPGDYQVTARRGFTDELRKPGTNDDAKQGERTAVRAGQTATVRLVVESQAASIRGSVVDTRGAAVSDAFVSVARESDAAGAASTAVQATRWTWNEHPVLTGTDGSFVVERLAPGKYTVRAYRRGGGEAIAEHVATGVTARLEIKPVGTIAGTVTRDGNPPDDFAVTVRDQTSGYRRREQFYRTAGHYSLSDLPKGTFIVAVDAAGGTKQIEVELGEGETKTGIDLALEGLVTVTGRVVELGTQTPVPGIRVFARRVRGSGSYAYSDDRQNISDEAGRFTVKNAPTGAISITGWIEKELGYTMPQAYRTVAAGASGTVDVGDVAVQKIRVKPGEAAGELGIHFAEQPPTTPPDQRELRVSFVDPQGPAAKLDVKSGDVLATVDGIDVRGENTVRARPLIAAPPGTAIALGLVRGPTVTVVLAKP